jgi:HD-like signal output (HDOD) protein
MTNSARQRIQDIVDRLPPMNVAVLELLRLAADPAASASDAGEVIMRDGVLVGSVLQEANSAMFSPCNPVTTAQNAVALIGMNRVTAIAVGTSSRVSLPMSATMYGVDAESVRQHQRLTVEAGLALGGRFTPEQRSELATVAVLHDMGKLVLSAMGPGWLSSTGLLTATTDAELIDLERDMFEVHHGTVGRMVCDHWGIPAHIGRAVELHHTANGGDLLAHGVYIADIVANAIDPHHGEPTAAPDGQLDASLALCGVSDITRVVERVEKMRSKAAAAVG